MTNSVTVNGNTYNDGSTPPNNMANGGFRQYMFPLMSDFIIDSAAKTAAATAAAAAALATANVALWVSGTTYTTGQNTYSPITFLTYRRKTNGAGTTDPSLDSTNWQAVVNIPSVVGSTIALAISAGAL